MEFPKGFLWGAATSAHQIEGNNINTDWWNWEVSKDGKRQFPLDSSGQACDSYNRYEEDFDLAKEMHNNATRLSIEWARIEPREGYFDQDALQHYKKVLNAARRRGLKTFVTLHHFTNPVWFAKKGGFVNFNSPKLFARYAHRCAQELGHLCDAILTINEPQVYALMSYTTGVWPPNKRNYIYSLIVQINMMRAHNAAYKSIKQVIDHPVGIVKNIAWYEPAPESNNPIDKLAAKFIYYLNEGFFLNPFVLKYCDILGLNFYFTTRLHNLKRKNPDNIISDMGWWVCPEGLKNTLLKLKRFNKPIYITENGIADSKDKLRKSFIQDMLTKSWEAIQAGVDLRGYFYWSLLDNYEWHQGFWPRFGLIEIDHKNGLKRKPRKSFYYYAQICQNNSIRD